MTQLQAVADPIAAKDAAPTMPLTDIVANLAKINEEKAKLDAALIEAKVAARDSVCKQVVDLIAANGFANDEILPLLMPKVRKARTKKAKPADGSAPAEDSASYPVYALKTDPTKTYKKGVLPGWLKEAIVAAGMDPAQGADRAKFKAEHMTVVAA